MADRFASRLLTSHGDPEAVFSSALQCYAVADRLALSSSLVAVYCKCLLERRSQFGAAARMAEQLRSALGDTTVRRHTALCKWMIRYYAEQVFIHKP